MTNPTDKIKATLEKQKAIIEAQTEASKKIEEERKQAIQDQTVQPAPTTSNNLNG